MHVVCGTEVNPYNYLGGMMFNCDLWNGWRLPSRQLCFNKSIYIVLHRKTFSDKLDETNEERNS